MGKDSNIGQKGIESIRIDSNYISNLPLGQGNEAKSGLAEFIKTDKETQRNNIAAKFPKHKIEFLKAQLKECRGNIKKIKGYKQKLKDDIAEYRQLIKDCAFREAELAKYNSENPEDAPKMKELRLKYPPYNVEALQQQILQFEEGIERCDEVIESDFHSISEIEKVLTLVEHRDKELRNV